MSKRPNKPRRQQQSKRGRDLRRTAEKFARAGVTVDPFVAVKRERQS